MDFEEYLTYIIYILVKFVIPTVFTIWNIYNLCSSKKFLFRTASWLTPIIGGVLYYLLFIILYETNGDWFEAVCGHKIHNIISSQHSMSILILIVIGFLGLLILSNFNANKLPPLISAVSIAAVLILNIVQIAFAIQVSGNFEREYSLLFYVYHANIFILSVSCVRKQITQQLEIYRNMLREEKQEKAANNWLYKKINSFSKYSVFVFVSLFFLIAVLEILFILLGQGVAAPIKAFTDTADWTFSMQVPPPPAECSCHYLCTVAAGGHRKIVKPLRFGTRRGSTIVVNRQLCIANAFEEYIQEKLPAFHRIIRRIYDKYGYPISKHITTPYRADVIYVLMKPLEWMFLIFLYAFDRKPEQRISRQYIYKNGK